MHLLVVNLLCIWSCTCLMLCTVGRYFVLNFRIPIVFDIIPLELVRFRNSRYPVSSCSFSCPACPLSPSLLYFKCKSRKRLSSFFDRVRPFLSLLASTTTLSSSSWCGTGFLGRTCPSSLRTEKECSRSGHLALTTGEATSSYSHTCVSQDLECIWPNEMYVYWVYDHIRSPEVVLCWMCKYV